MNFSITAIIPARGGSKGIPRKNLQLVGGTTLIERSILLAQKSGIFEEIIVSTDSTEIATVAERRGGVVHHRDPKTATDNARSEDALQDAIADLEPSTSHIGFLECTSPFIDPEDLVKAWQQLLESGSDCLFSASHSHELHWNQTPAGVTPLGHNPMNQTSRQLRAPTLVETGAFYLFSSAGFKIHKNRFFGNIEAYLVPRAHALEIDYPEDLLIANSLAREIDRYIF